VVVGSAGQRHKQKPGLIGFSASFAAAAAAAAAASAAFLALSWFTSSTACCKFLMGSGTATDDSFNSENVEESVIGLECQMNALPLPDGDCPSAASPGESCEQLMSGVISLGITGLQVK